MPIVHVTRKERHFEQARKSIHTGRMKMIIKGDEISGRRFCMTNLLAGIFQVSSTEEKNTSSQNASGLLLHFVCGRLDGDDRRENLKKSGQLFL